MDRRDSHCRRIATAIIAIITTTGTINGVASQPSKGILGKAFPVQAGIKSIAAIGIPCGHAGHPTNRIVLGGNIATAPLATGIDTNLPDRIHNVAIFTQNNRIIPIEEATGRR